MADPIAAGIVGKLYGEPGSPEAKHTTDTVADEIVAYLPNPGQFAQNISAARKMPDGTIVLIMDNDQEFTLTLREELV